MVILNELVVVVVEFTQQDGRYLGSRGPFSKYRNMKQTVLTAKSRGGTLVTRAYQLRKLLTVEIYSQYAAKNLDLL